VLAGLAPTWFLLRLLIEKAPRVLLAIVLLVASDSDRIAASHAVTRRGHSGHRAGAL